MGRRVIDPLARYRAKVDQRGPTECWPWTAGRFDKGYGAFRLGEKQVKAHRFGYEALVGPIGDGLYVCHTCDNPPCQNPAHWFLGTHRDNAIDREQKGRGRYKQVGLVVRVHPGRARGERHGRAKLNAEDVRAIRARRNGGESQQSIADDLGVSQKLISKIVRYEIWRDVPDQ